MDPYNNLIDRHRAMRTMIWSIDIEPLEKLIFLYAVQYSDPAVYGDPPEGLPPFAPTSLAELSKEVGASILETSRALSSLRKMGLVEVVDTRLLPGGGAVPRNELYLAPEFEILSIVFAEKHGGRS